MVAPSHVASGTYLSGSAASASVAVPSGAASGQCAVVVMFIDGAALDDDPTPPAGFDPAEGSPVQITGVGGQHSLYVWLKRLTGADSGTYDFTWTGSRYREAQAHLYEDVAAAGDLLDSPTDTASDLANSTTTPAVEVTTEGPDRLLLWAATCWSGGTWTAPTDFTKRMQGAAGVVTLCDMAQASAGATGSITGTISNADKRTVWLGALRGTTSEAATHEAEASATVTAAGTATAAGTKPVSASQQVTAQATAIGTAVRPAVVDLEVSAQASAAGTAVRAAGGSVAVSAGLSASATGVRAVGASAPVSVALSASASVTKSAATSLTVTAATSVTGATGGTAPSGTIGGRTAIAVSGTASGPAGVAIGGTISG